MNLRILKKLSKRAAPLLAALGDNREQFRAARDDNYTGLIINARKHFERGRSVHADLIREGESKTPAKDGCGFVYAAPPSHPRKGTIMLCAAHSPTWGDAEHSWQKALQHDDDDDPERRQAFDRALAAHLAAGGSRDDKLTHAL